MSSFEGPLGSPKKQQKGARALLAGREFDALAREPLLAVLEALRDENGKCGPDQNRVSLREVGAAIGRLGEEGLRSLMRLFVMCIDKEEGKASFYPDSFFKGTRYSDMDWREANRLRVIGLELLGYSRLPQAFAVLLTILKTDSACAVPLVLDGCRVTVGEPADEAVVARSLETLSADLGIALDPTTQAWCAVKQKQWDRVVAIGDPAVEPLTLDSIGFRYDEERVKVLVRIGTPLATNAVLKFVEDQKTQFMGNSYVYHRSLLAAIEALGKYGGQEAVELLKSLRSLGWDALNCVTKCSFGNAIEVALQTLDARFMTSGAKPLPEQGSIDRRTIRLVHDSVERGDVEKVAQLLKSDQRLVNALEDEIGRRTALHKAAMAGAKKDMVVLLIRQGADITAEDKPGWTSLHWAAFLGHSEVVHTLVAAGADVNCKSKMRVITGRLNNTTLSFPEATTPLHAAVAGAASAEIVGLLLDKGADVNATDKDGRTPLWQASQPLPEGWVGYTRSRGEVAKILVEHGARV